MVEPQDFEHCNVIKIKGKNDNEKRNTPFLLQGATSSTSYHKQSQYFSNVVKCSHVEIILKEHVTSTPKVHQHKEKPIFGPSEKNTKMTTFSTVANYSTLE